MYPGFLIPEVSVVEKIVRPLIVYLFLLIAFRLVGKRELGSMTPFDLIILLTISNVVQNAMIGPDNSLTGGLIGAAALLAANELVAWLSFRFPFFDRFIQGTPTVLVLDGRVQTRALEHELMTMDDLRHALRKNQVDPDTELASIRRAELDSDGSLTITRRRADAFAPRAQRRGKLRSDL